MGDPKKHRKKYDTPSHPWKKERLDIENEIKQKYGLKNKKEIYRADSFLRKIKSIIKKLASSQTEQSAKEQEQLLTRLRKMSLISETATADEILGLSLKDVMERRLQSIILKKGLANSMKQARQFIVHQHIKIGDKKITSPGYLVSGSEELMLTFDQSSSLSKEDHPERKASKEEIRKELEKTKVKKQKPLDADLDVPEIIAPLKEAIISEEEAAEIEQALNEERQKEE